MCTKCTNSIHTPGLPSRKAEIKKLMQGPQRWFNRGISGLDFAELDSSPPNDRSTSLYYPTKKGWSQARPMWDFNREGISLVITCFIIEYNLSSGWTHRRPCRVLEGRKLTQLPYCYPLSTAIISELQLFPPLAQNASLTIICPKGQKYRDKRMKPESYA